MELPRKMLEEFAIKTTPKIVKYKIFVMDKSIDENHLSQPLQTKNEHLKVPATFLTGYNGIFNINEKKQ